MFYCKLCEKNSVFSSNFCEETCRPIKNIMNIYGNKEVLEILKSICINDDTKRKQLIQEIKHTDDSYDKKSIELRSGKKC